MNQTAETGFVSLPATPVMTPPDVESERALLGAVLMDSHDVMPAVLELRLKPQDFQSPVHGEIFSTMLLIYESGAAVDQLTLMNALQGRGSLAAVGGAAYLAELFDNIGIPSHAAQYATIIIERANVRRLMVVASELVDKCRSNPASAAELLEEAEAEIFKIRGDRDVNSLAPVYERMDDVFSSIVSRRGLDGGISGIPSGFKYLDWKTGGFQRSDLIILAGRPGMGKTSLALNFALNAAIPSLRQDHKNLPNVSVAVFSLEMNCEQLLQRLLCQVGRHDLLSLRTGRLDDDELGRLANTSSSLRQAPIFIDDTSALRPLELKAKARRLQSVLRSRGEVLGLVVVDYLQLMRPNERHHNREQDVSEISSSLKAMAKELNVPVLTLSQLRRIEKGGEPDLSDLRESGSIEQDADLVLFISRPDAGKSKEGDQSAKGESVLKIKKHRNGPIGDVFMTFIEKSSSFVPSANYRSFEEDE